MTGRFSDFPACALQVPKLLKPPLHSTALRAIGSLAEVAGVPLLMSFEAPIFCRVSLVSYGSLSACPSDKGM